MTRREKSKRIKREEKSKPSYHETKKSFRHPCHRRIPNSKHRFPEQRLTLPPIHVSSSSIHHEWKRQLGGLIRYYIHHSKRKDAEREVERMYYQSGCSISGTKESILEALGVKIKEDWIDLSMAVEVIDEKERIKSTVDHQGYILPRTVKAGEGPAHAHEAWNIVMVPEWAVGRAFYFQVANRSPLDLSCEITLDGNHVVAKNAPIPKHSIRTVKPDNHRYFRPHQWILQPATKVKLASLGHDSATVAKARDQSSHTSLPVIQQTTHSDRYNGIRPNDSITTRSTQYPDPTLFGWTFTGGSKDSDVMEYFEIATNMGGKVQMDFDSSQASIHTILFHPTTGPMVLMPKNTTVTPEEFQTILKNPRYTTQKPVAIMTPSTTPNESSSEQVHEMETEMDEDVNVKNVSNHPMERAVAETKVSSHYYAKNEDYDFQTQGHLNRQTELKKLHQTSDWCQWKEAAQQEYAVVHAKFYISQPQSQRFITHRKVYHKGHKGQEHRRKHGLEPLPKQATIVDIKAAENATLGTKFEARGTVNTNKHAKRSTVRMNRIHGLTETEKGEHIFECKLYYRAEDVVRQMSIQDEEESDDACDEKMNDENDNEDAFSLHDYKLEKIHQVKQQRLNPIEGIINEDEADEMLQNCLVKINACDNKIDIDEVIKIYYGAVIKNQFTAIANEEVKPS